MLQAAGATQCARQIGGRFSHTLVEEAKRVSGITETTDLLTYALIRVALEDNFGERLLARKGRLGGPVAAEPKVRLSAAG